MTHGPYFCSMKAMLFAAGLGTRLKPFTDHHPKALAIVNGMTLLEHNIRYLQRAGIYEVVVNVHHFADQIETILEQQEGFGSRVTISDERDAVLETGGGLKKAAPYFEGAEEVLVMNVDVLTNLNLHNLIGRHRATNAMATLAVMNRKSSRYFLFDEQMQLCGWQHNGTGEQRISRQAPVFHPFAFSGIQVIAGRLLRELKQEGKFSMVDVYLDLAKTNKITGYDHTGDLFLDVGKPESLEQAAQLFS